MIRSLRSLLAVPLLIPVVPGAAASATPEEVLECQAFIVGAGRDAIPEFEFLQDVKLDVRLRNASGGTLRLLREGGEVPYSVIPSLFRLTLNDASGAAVPLPSWEYEGRHFLCTDAEVRELPPGRVQAFTISIGDWIGWKNAVLEPGEYQLQLSYLGLPAVPEGPSPPQREYYLKTLAFAAGAWHGEATATPLRFRIVDRARDVAWGEANDGLRCGARLPSEGKTFLFGESLRAIVLIENVGGETVSFSREQPAPQEDDLKVREDSGFVFNGGKVLTTGIMPLVGHRLRPGERIRVDPRPVDLRLSDAGGRFASPGFIAAMPGAHAVTFRLLLRPTAPSWTPSGAVPWNGTLTTGRLELVFAERR